MDLKRGSGGIVDIEFVVQYLVLAHAHDHPSLTEFTDNVRILDAVSELELLPADEAGAAQGGLSRAACRMASQRPGHPRHGARRADTGRYRDDVQATWELVFRRRLNDPDEKWKTCLTAMDGSGRTAS